MTLILGLTGGIAAGKSSVATMFAAFGAVVVSADQLAREAVAAGTPALQALVATFGDGIVDGAGELDRAALAALVFADASARERLNAITHPAIARLAEARLDALRARRVPLVVYEAPLLFEAGAERRVDRVLAVVVDPQIQRLRLAERDRLPPQAIDARIAAQWPQSAKVARADYVIDNSGPLEETRRQVAVLYHLLLSAGHS
ncbi:MAG: dephospho-CoA kinase [Deltaproteobacteria bacterium]|nr:MAG: dephospho-CoA kinase [Deltaproteobacteria bacterium]